MSRSAPAWFRFCPRCAAPLTTRAVGGKPRRTCPHCDYVHFVEPKVGVGVFVLSAGRVLLVQRAMEPERGRWSLPAGYLDPGEDPRAVAARETLEETSLRVDIGQLIDVYHNPPDSGGASIFILYRAHLVGGTIAAGDDAAAAGFFGPDELPELAFHSTREMVRRHLK